MRIEVTCRLAAAALAAAIFSVSPSGAGAPAGAWAERVQVVYDPDAGSVERMRLRAWDAEPHLNLEFVWEPGPASPRGDMAEGAISGTGKLIWRVRGAAAHDRRSIHSTYIGEMVDGRRHGKGRLETRDGEVREGIWRAGLLEGEGMLLDASGNRYEGSFAAGLPHGRGRQAMADGSIYEGEFRDGLRHGQGVLRLAGGTSYDSVWTDGVETGARPDVLADALLGGLLRAQSGGGDAGKVDVSIVVDQRLTRQADLKYTHAVFDDRIEIYPTNEGMVESWLGSATIRDWGYYLTFGRVEWTDAPAFLVASFETNDKSRVRVDGFELQVADSQVYRKPFLSSHNHLGCVGFRPGFSLQNNGWGPARRGNLSVHFYDLEAPERTSRTFSVPVADLDFAVEVSLRDVLDEAGVDTATLEQGRYTCSSAEALPQCQAELKQQVDFGELTDLLGGDYLTVLGVGGTYNYVWSDDRGNEYAASEPFDTIMQLAAIETEINVAESGDGWGGAPAALRYQEVHLPQDQQDYVIDMPIRGNRSLSDHTARLKVYAETSSVHQFRVALRLAGGSERYSKPVSLFKIRPVDRDDYQVPEPATGCYLDPIYRPIPD